MTDIEIVRACAEAMGVTIVWNNYLQLFQSDSGTLDARYYDPLHDDAQAMALVKKFEMQLHHDLNGWHATVWLTEKNTLIPANNADLNKAICTAVASLHSAKG